MPKRKALTKKQHEDGRYEISLQELYEIFEKRAEKFVKDMEDVRESHWLPAGDAQLWNLFHASTGVAKALAGYCYLEAKRQEEMIDEQQRRKAKRLQLASEKSSAGIKSNTGRPTFEKVQTTSRGRKRIVRP
jgi:biotin synthase-like enzyme